MLRSDWSGEKDVPRSARERLLEQALRSTRDSVVITDVAGKILYANQACLECHGYCEDELLGRPVSILQSPNNPSHYCRDAHEATLRGHWSGELLDVAKDGREFPIHLTSTVIRDEHGAPLAAVGISREITERKTDSALPSTQELLVSLLEHTPAAIYATSLDDRFLFVNSEWERATGKRREDTLGCKLRDVFPEDAARRFRDSSLTVFNTKRPVSVESILELPDGPHVFQTVKFPLRDATGHITAVAGVSFEITDRKRAERALHESEERYRQLVEVCPEAIVLHDGERFCYANPAAAKLLGVEDAALLVGRPILDFVSPEYRPSVIERTRRVLVDRQRVPLATKKLVRLDGRTVDAEITSGPVTYAGKTHVQVCIRDVTKRKLVEHALAREYDLLRALMNEMPDTIYFKDTESRFTRVNRAQAELLGLADSRQATGKTDADFFTPEFAAEALADEQRILRTGEPLIGKIEEVKLRDGRVRRMSVTKVAIRDPQGAIAGLVGISRSLDAPLDRRPRPGRVLLVEDDEMNRVFQQEALEASGIRCLAAGDGEEGLALFRAHADEMDLVVTDIAMPKMRGDDMIAEIRKLAPTVPILVVSGLAHGAVAAQLRQLNVTAILDKPFTAAAFLERIRSLLRERA